MAQNLSNGRQRKEKRSRKDSLQPLFLCGSVLFLLGFLGILLICSGGKAPSSSFPTGPENTVIHITAGGDLNITDNVIKAEADGGFSGVFLDVSHLFANSDLSVLNFEGNFYGQPYGTQSKSAPQSLAKALSEAGVDLLQLANSYSIKNGISGLLSTIDTVRDAGLLPLGAYRDKKEAKESGGFTLTEVQGVKVAFVAFTKGMDGMTLPEGSEGCINVLYTDYNSNYQKVDTEGISRVLNNVKAAGADIVVAMLHWGSEFNDTVSKSQEKICALLQMSGVDVIIGTHPHYVQQMKFDAERNTFVAYSLGDFFGDAARAGSEYSVILDLEITKNNFTGEAKVTNYSYTPIFTMHEEGKPMRVLRLREAMAAYENNYVDKVSEGTYKAMAYALTRIEARINGK